VKHSLLIQPESITTVSRGAPSQDTMYLEAIPLKCGSNSFISAPSGLADLDDDGCFQIKVANTTQYNIHIPAGELLGCLTKASNSLKSIKAMTKLELSTFHDRASQLATLIPNLDALSVTSKEKLNSDESLESEDTEHLGWGPKTTDPRPSQVYPSDKLQEIIDVDPALEPSQRNTLYKIVKKNQAAFGFDGRLGHLKSKVHINSMPGTKPISVPPYYASPAKHDLINKQINLWLLQDVMEESKSCFEDHVQNTGGPRNTVQGLFGICSRAGWRISMVWRAAVKTRVKVLWQPCMYQLQH
jgi:hypothetical protein